jgi:RimJ/RimL family protein N-acetyltransferase
MKISWKLLLGRCVFGFAILCGSFCFAEMDTERLRLRSWQDGDVEKIYEMVQDAEVNQYLKHVNFEQYSVLKKVAENANKSIEEKGYGYFVCELKETGEVIGLIGLNYIQLDDPHFPCYTVSWILGKRYWKRGYATEGALKLLSLGFENCKMGRIYACTSVDNTASRRVMERLGMRWVDRFNFPGIEKSHPLSEQVLYEIVR